MLDLANCFVVGSFGYWILYPGYHGTLGIMGPVKPFCRRILLILDPVFFCHGTCLPPTGFIYEGVTTRFDPSKMTRFIFEAFPYYVPHWCLPPRPGLGSVECIGWVSDCLCRAAVGGL